MSAVVYPGGFPPDVVDDDEDAELRYLAAECERQGHLIHTCPACGDRSCERCGWFELGERR